MADNSFITLLEAVDKSVRITSAGGEIVTTFYVEPASAVPAIISRLLGFVVGDGVQGGSGTNIPYDRQLPACDYDYPFYYCVEAHVSPFDRRSVTSSPALLLRQYGGASVTPSDIDKALANPIIFDGPACVNPDGSYNQANSPNMCGAYVEATYRPLLSIYSGAMTGDGATPQNCFDYIDPQMYTCSRQFAANGVPGQQNGFVLKDYITHLPAQFPNATGSSLLVTESWQEFTIRRVMCPSVPWDTIRQLQNRINGQQAWSPANMTIPGLAFADPSNPGQLIKNTFPIGTVRFDSAEPIMRVVPKSFTTDPTQFGVAGDGLPVINSMYWWDILYKFSWRTTWSQWVQYDQTVVGPSFITWNCDWYVGAPQSVFASLINAIASGYNGLPTWVEMNFEQPTNSVISTNVRRKYLDAEDTKLPVNNPLPTGATHPFDALFLMNAP